MVIADFSLNLVPRSPLRTGLNKAGKRPFGAAYAKHVGERQHVVGLFLATLEAGGDANRFDRRHALATNSGRAAAPPSPSLVGLTLRQVRLSAGLHQRDPNLLQTRQQRRDGQAAGRGN
jgi:hypothetical protein